MTTALRDEAHQVRDGVRMLRPDMDIPYRDGAEDRLFDLVSTAQDVGSDSVEMLAGANGWAERYHTHPARANILRALDIPQGARVLEIGSGCGPITRYLGEIGAVVDALEPVLPRARVARERTRDLPGVEVFCGLLDDLPDEPVYDLVVVVGVLEYVAAGAADLEPYLAFLRGCRARLRPGGRLALAIENKLGVKYLTGTGEDHSGRIFDSLEDYPRGSPARTFSASALLDLVHRSGFAPRLLSVFPDYKHTRVVFDVDALSGVAPDLIETLPSFPSRFAGTRSLRLASEARLWRELARDQVGAHFANSFLVLGESVGDEAPGESGITPPLWPEERLARYFSIDRLPQYRAITTIEQRPGEVVFDRAYAPEPGPMIEHGDTSWTYVQGRTFLDSFATGDEAERRQLLQGWINLLQQRADATESSDSADLPLDAIPTNLLVTGTGRLALIDSEFHDRGTIERVVRRGLFWLAVHLSRTTIPETWDPDLSVAELVPTLAGLADLDRFGWSWDWPEFCRTEAAFQVAVTCHYLGDDPLADAEAALTTLRDSRLWDSPLGRRLHHRADDDERGRGRAEESLREAVSERDGLRVDLSTAVAARRASERAAAASAKATARAELRVEKLDAKVERLEAKLGRSEQRTAEAKAALQRLRSSRSYRISAAVRSGLRRVRPPWVERKAP